MKLRLKSLLLILLEFEAGLILIFSPWSAFWEQNALITYHPPLADFILNNFSRGAVSGVGLVLLLMGFLDAYNLSTR